MEYTAIDANKFDYTKIISLDKLEKGAYKMLLDDGSEINVKLDVPAFISLTTKIRHYHERLVKETNERAAKISELKLSAPNQDSQFDSDNGPLDIVDEPFLPVYGLSEARSIDPEYSIILVSDSDIANRVSLGATRCEWSDLVGGEDLLKNLYPGDANSFDAPVRWNELNLMKIKKSQSERYYKYTQSQQSTIEALEADYQQRGGMLVSYGGISGIRSRKEILNGKLK